MNEKIEIEMQPVESSNIAAIGFKDGTLKVQFKSGGTYKTDGASQSDFDEFVSSKSKGQHFNKVLKSAFSWSRIEKKG